jgi:hypothetical protein
MRPHPAVLALFALALLPHSSHAQWSSLGAPVSIGHGWPTPVGGTVPVAIPDGSGGAIVAWSDLSAIWIQRITDQGSVAPGWPADGLLATTNSHGLGDQNFPSITSDGAGGAIVAWRDIGRGIGTFRAIFAQRVTPDGGRAWPDTGVAVSRPPSGANPDAPFITSDGAGGAFIAWSDRRTLTYRPYAARITGTGALAPSWTPEGMLVSTVDVQGTVASVVADTLGGVYVQWTDDRDGPGMDLFAQHLTATGALASGSVPGGTLICTATDARHNAIGIEDGAGGALYASPDGRNLVDVEVYSQRLGANGALAPGWTLAGFPIAATAGNQANIANLPPRVGIVSDRAGGAIVAWQDDRNGPFDIYANRVTGAGTQAAGWTLNGTRVCTAAGAQWFPLVAPDTTGGAFVAWFDRRNGVDYDVYATRLTPDGAIAPGWPVDGKLVCAAPGDQFQGVLVPDGEAGAIVVWHDTRRGDLEHPDLYAARVTGDGAVPALPSVLRAVAQSDRVSITWFAAERGSCAIQRAMVGADWSTVGTSGVDGNGWLVYEDRDVTAGRRYGYRLAIGSGYAGETWIDVPSGALALAGAVSNPARGDLAVAFTLPGGGPARLELVSPAGRVVVAREVSALGDGSHRVDLAQGRTLARGLYFLRLVRGDEVRTRRVVYLP